MTTLEGATGGAEVHEALADALFVAFVHVADAGQGLTARDVEAWHAWSQRPRPESSSVLQAVLVNLARRFDVLWKRHVASGVAPELERISVGLRRWEEAFGPQEAEALRAEFEALLETCAPRRRRGLAWALQRGTPQARVEARARVEAAMQARPGVATSGPGGAPAQAAAAAAEAQPQAAAGARVERLLLPDWPPGPRRLRCVAVIEETHDVRTFVFRDVQPGLFAYLPGQFMTLALPLEPGRVLRRSYTLSSSPSRPHSLSITVKRVPGGRGSNWIHEHLRPGSECDVTGPHGKFTCGLAPLNPRLLLIAAGSGITPVMSMLRWLADTAAEVDVVLVNNVRTPADVIFEAELRYLSTRLGARARLLVVPSRVEPGQHWSGPTGRFEGEWLRAVVPDFAERAVYTCGPAPYMAHVRSTLERMGLPPESYHEESFGAGPRPAAGGVPREAGASGVSAPAGATTAPAGAPLAASSPPARGTEAPTGAVTAPPGALGASPGPASAAVQGLAPATDQGAAAGEAETPVTVRFVRSGRVVKARAGVGLLELAEAEGIELPSSCRAGQCGTCRVRLLAGAVSMDEQQALEERELSEGWVLACVSTLRPGELEVEA